MKLRWVLAIVAVVLVAGGPAAQEIPPYRPGQAGVLAPRLIKEVKPWYTADAMRARAAGTVGLTCTVQPDGRAGDCRVVRPLRPDLDQSAIGAVSLWVFAPGTRDGVAVPVVVEIEISFALRDNPGRPDFDSPQVAKKGDAGLVMPQVIDDPKPRYHAEAMREAISGVVVLDCIVDRDGSVSDVRVATPLDPRLDAEAVGALRSWRFKPGTKDNVPVPVQVQVEMTFRVK